MLDAQTVAFIDVTAADMLATLSEELAALGVALVVAHDIGQVRDTLRETGLEDSIGSRTYATVDQAIEALTGRALRVLRPAEAQPAHSTVEGKCPATRAPGSREAEEWVGGASNREPE